MDNKKIESLIAKLINNEIVLIPTDTIYGLSAIASNAENQKKINELKNSDLNKPLIILVSSLEQINDFQIDEEAIEKFLSENPTTVLLKGKFSICAFRLIKSKCYLKNIIDIVGPIYSTSANFSGNNYICDKNTFKNLIKNEDNFYWDGEKINNSSKIFDNINKLYLR